MIPTFPEPTYFGRLRHWALSDLLAYEAVLAGKPVPEIDPADERYLTAAQVRARYGNVSDMWLWRRLAKRDGRNAPAAMTAA